MPTAKTDAERVSEVHTHYLAVYALYIERLLREREEAALTRRLETLGWAAYTHV